MAKPEEKRYKHEQALDKEFINLYGQIQNVQKEANEQKSIKNVKSVSVSTMNKNVIHLHKDSSGVQKASIRVNNKLYEFTLTEI